MAFQPGPLTGSFAKRAQAPRMKELSATSCVVALAREYVPNVIQSSEAWKTPMLG